jgi:hypothetical protein
MSIEESQYEIVLVIVCLLYALCSIPCMLLCYYYWDMFISREKITNNQINIPLVDQVNIV